MQRTFYEVLGVPRNASKTEIKEKYYALARKFHPDRAQDKQTADRLFVQINRAYSTLYNDAKRAKYDAGLDGISQVPSRPSPSSASSYAAPRPQPQPQPAPQPPTVEQVRTWFDQASRKQLAGDIEAATALCTRVLQADPTNFPGLLLMGDLLSQTGKLEQGLQEYEKAAKIQPGNHLLREKMNRLRSLIERRSTNSPAAKTAPAVQAKPIIQKEPEVKTDSRSLFGRLMNRK